MSKFMDKIANALGFSNPDDDQDEQDQVEDDYDADDYVDDDTYRSSSYGSSSYSGSRSSSYGSSYSSPSYSGYGSSYGSAYSSSYRGSSTPSQYHVTSSRTVNSRNGGKVLNLNASVQMEVVIASPETFDEAREIAEKIKDNKPVIINLEFVAHDVAQRITDFLCGCCCAMDGNIQRIANKIFMIAPGNVDFDSDVDLRQSLESEDIGFIYGDSNKNG